MTEKRDITKEDDGLCMDEVVYSGSSDLSSQTQHRPSSASMGVGVVFLLFIVALMVAVWVISGVAGSQAREQGALTLRQSVMDTAMQCFAIEGAYPPSLEYLESNYGLSVNDEDYSIRYEVFASNIMPSVVVIPR